MEGRLLVVGDDPRARAALARALGGEGFDVVPAPDAATAMAQLRADPPDLVLLDRALPDDDGVEVCRRLRESGEAVPIVMLSARDAVAERVEVLDAGADAVVARPFPTAELVARVRALLRRTRGAGPRWRRRLDDLVLDARTREVRRGARPVELTRREFELLAVLLDNPGRVMPRERLLGEAWGMDGGAANALEVYVGYLRRKLEAGGEPRMIHTVRGVGYVLRRPRRTTPPRPSP